MGLLGDPLSGLLIGGTAPPAAYDPSNYFTGGTKVAWYPFYDSTKVLDASNAVAANNVKAKTITDAWGNSRDLVQATAGDQATVKTGTINTTLQCIEYAATSSVGYIPSTFTSQLNSASSCTIGGVFSIADAASNHELFFCYDNSYSYARTHAYHITDTPTANWNTADGVNQGNDPFGGGGVIATGNTTYHAALFQFDYANGVTTLFYNNATKLTRTNGAAQNLPNTTLNEPHFLRSLKGRVVDLFMYKNAKMDSTQRAAWFTDVKTKFGLTGY